MVTRDYICGHCGYRAGERQRLSEPLLTSCPSCKAPSYHRDYSTPHTLSFTIAGSRTVNGERRFWRPFIGRERNGNETVYTSESQMLRSEYERAQALPHLSKRGRLNHARNQLKTARAEHGLRPGTTAAAAAQAVAAHAPSASRGAR